MSEAGKIYAAIANVIADVGTVAKDKVNKQQGFKFRSVDDVYNALHPALAKNKVFIVPDILERKVETVNVGRNGTSMYHVTCQIRFTFYAEDGSSVECTLVGEAMDTGDKATNKAMAIAYKYACFQVFCIPTEEMLDPDAERPEADDRNKTATGRDGAPAKKTPAAKAPDDKKKPVGREVPKSRSSESDGEKPDRQTGVQEGTVTPEMLQTIESEIARTGVPRETILGLFKVKSLDQLTSANYEKLMKKFQATPDLKKGE